jgi:ribosome-binding protein aMBF1 (putative translation factor)
VARKELPKGWTDGSVRDLLDLSDDEAGVIETRVRLAEEVREKRRARRITQKELARGIESTQSRIARLEQANTSIEMLVRALLALGSDRKEIGRLLAA